MKILHITDTHNFYNNMGYNSDVDIVVHTGDAQCHNAVEFYKFIEWYKNYPVKNKIYVAGNHDIFVEKNESLCKEIFKDSNIIYLNKNSVTINGLKFYGDPMSPRFGTWSFMVDRSKMNKHWEYIPKDVDVLLTHTPPKGILDLTENYDRSLEMCGCSALQKRIFKNNYPNLKLHAFGHIHCLSDDCEILTDDGWKDYKNIKFYNKILNYNTISNCLEYDSINEIIKSDYYGDAYEIINPYFNKIVTPNHDILLSDNSKIKAENLYNNIKTNEPFKVKISFDYNKEDYLISDDEIRLAVWVATDGTRDSNRWRFHLKKDRKIQRLTKLLNKMNIDYNIGQYSKNNSVKISFVDKYFKYTKPLPTIFKNLSKRQIKILIGEYLQTDGNFDKTSKNMLGQISSSKKEEIDLLQELLLKGGFGFSTYSKKNSKHQYINIKKDTIKEYSICKNHIKKLRYEGKIWCLNTNNGNFFIRRNGKVMITGNSGHGIINTGLRTLNNIVFSNATAVTDGEFSKGITYFGNIIEI